MHHGRSARLSDSTLRFLPVQVCSGEENELCRHRCAIQGDTSIRYIERTVGHRHEIRFVGNGVFVEEDSPLDMCKEAVIDPERKPACINLILNEANMGVRITSGYTRGFHLSNLIRIYTEIDPRVIQLLRLLRYFAKVCRHT